MDFSKNFSDGLEDKIFLKNYAIVIKDLNLVLHCGDIKEEKKLGIEALINLELEAIDFVDYVSVYKLVEDFSQREFKYLEDFCLSLAKEIFNNFKQITKISVYVTKKSLPFNTYAREIGVKLIFEREKNEKKV